ncbi:TlpA family protein disulfide reductase [Paenibacillus thermotolerans]|uniref:TlpA family protein disulfide reductase n=1 Tax=Paenibacillus thermotolerans TaxID=3027807 RepID=UPI002367DED0|nr:MULTISPECIES: TlpA disulfide reductase family protein [unclassified Paenibacillus]
MKKTLFTLIAVIALAGIAVAQQFATAHTNALPSEEAPKIGYLAPSFQLSTLDGGVLGVSRGEREKALLINFWASWCDPCRLEAPFLAELHAKYGDRLEIYGVNALKFDSLDGVKAFVKLYQYKFPILLDDKSAVYDLYKVPGYPTSVLVDRNGVIKDIVIGLPDHGEFEKKIKKLVR